MIGTTKPDPRFVRFFATLHRNLVTWTDGRLFTSYRGEPMVLLTTTGRRTGEPRTWPLTGLRVGDGWAVAASNGGHDRDPAWYLNLRANPDATVQEGKRKVAVRARFTEGEERDALYRRFEEYMGNYAAYRRATTRVIPVVVLEPVTESTAG